VFYWSRSKNTSLPIPATARQANRQLIPGAHLFIDGIPVELIQLLETRNANQEWLCKLLFVEPAEVVKTFNSRLYYNGLHGAA
jgi:hypothetical protein